MKTKLVTVLKRTKPEGLKDKLAVLEMIKRGERAIQDGRFSSHKKARARMSRWLKQSGPTCSVQY